MPRIIMPLGVDMFFMDPGIKLGLIIELVHTSTALLVVKNISYQSASSCDPNLSILPPGPVPSLWISPQHYN